jgi:hypothetical protein
MKRRAFSDIFRGVIRGDNAFWKVGRHVTVPRSAGLKAGLALLLT